MKNFAIIDSENKSIIDTIQKHFGNTCPVLSNVDNFDDYELLVLTGYDSEFSKPEHAQVINLHPALLPAFKGNEAVKETFLSGVKVGGVTIHNVEKDNFYGKIIAQYPVLIGLTTNFSDYLQEIEVVSQKLYPVVIESIINDKVFDFHELFNTGCASGKPCSNKCSGCSNCGDC